ncbi:MAG: 6-bladed beta-propeller [Candidatus Micrarchaeota archaeon]|nr:6-bladed beta-propeller [Candidatus Micrarchaeota archaeon]
MRAFAVFAFLAFCASSFASFSFLYSFNGSNPDDNSDYFQFSRPVGLLRVGASLYVSDAGKGAVYVVSPQLPNRTGMIGSMRSFDSPLRMAYSGGLLYIPDGAKIKVWEGAGSEVLDWSQGSNFIRASSILPEGETVYISDLDRGKVFAYSNSTRGYSRVAIESGPSDGFLSSPQQIKKYKGRYFVSDSAKKLIFVYNESFGFLGSIGRGRGSIELLSPRGIDIAHERLYVADASANRVVVFSLDGYPIEVLNASTPEGNFSYPEGVMVDGERLFVADSGNRLLKVFSINLSVGNDSVRASILSANYSVSRLLELQAVASKLSLPSDPSSSIEDLAAAQQDYDHFLFSSASVLAQRASQKAESDYNALAQAVELKVRRIVKEQQERLLPYRSRLSGKPPLLFSQFDNKVADINAKLSSKSYSAAAEAALSLPNLASQAIASAESQQKEEMERKEGKVAKEMLARMADAVGRLDALKQKAAQYRQPINTSLSEALIAEANRSAREGDLQSFNRTISLAILEIESFEATVSSSAGEIDSALSAISSAEAKMNETISKPVLLAPDFSEERRLVAQARETAFSSPALAVKMAQDAQKSAERKMEEARALSVAVAAVLIVVIMIAVLAAAFYLHLLRRRAEAEKKRARQDKKARQGQESRQGG